MTKPPLLSADDAAAPPPLGATPFPRTGKRGAPQAFPRKLRRLLDEQPPDVVRWRADGAAFAVMDMARFRAEVLERYFSHTKFASFQRQLNLYGFHKQMHVEERECYAHPHFHRRLQARGSDSGRGSGREARDRSSQYCFPSYVAPVVPPRL